MKIVLIQPPIQDFYETKIRLQPIGLAYLKATLNQFHSDVEVIVRDYHTGRGRRTIAWPKELSYLKDYYSLLDRGPFSTFHHYYHFGASFDEIETDLRDLKPDLIGISSLFTPYFRQALEVAKIAKKNEKNIPVLMGGSHVSAVPQSVLACSEVDYVICGEGEKALVDFVSFLKGERFIEQVGGLGYKKSGVMHFNPIGENYSLDEIPFPDLQPFSLKCYQYAGRPMAFMITSRSCPHQCTFCSVHLTFGSRYRRRSVEDIVSEIQLRYQEGYRTIDFEDDNLTFFKQEMKEICLRLIQIFPNKEMQFLAMNGISYLSLDDELLDLMWRAGFTHLNLALVSSDKTVRETTKRPHTIEKYCQVVTKSHLLNFHIVSYQILGLPNESLASMIQTLAFNSRLPVLLGASMFYQTPNSPIALKYADHLTEEDHFKARNTAMAIETEEFSRKDIYSLFIVTRIFNYLKGLKLDQDESLSKVLREKQDEVGVQILTDCLNNKILSALTSHGRVSLPNFQFHLLEEVMKQAEYVSTQSGHKIYLNLI